MSATSSHREQDGSGRPAGRSTSFRRGLKIFMLAAVVVFLVSSYSNHWLSMSGVPIDNSRRESLPDFQYPQLEGGDWRLSDHRGQVVLLNFWASWCPPCRQETPGLVRLAEQLQSSGVGIVGISMDDDPSAISGFVKSFHVPYPVLLPTPGSQMAGSIESLPTSLLLDRSGKVARTYVGAVTESTLAHDIQQLLHESEYPARVEKRVSHA